jgi:hypothetical protein
MDQQQMDAKIINNHNMTANGFFLTRSQDASNEQSFLALATEMINERLKEKSLRSSNVLDNLVLLEDLVQVVTDQISERRAEFNISPDGLYGFMWVTTIGCLSAYNEKIRRIKESTKLTRVPIQRQAAGQDRQDRSAGQDRQDRQDRNDGYERPREQIRRDEYRGRRDGRDGRDARERDDRDGRQSRGGYYGVRNRSRSR